MPLISFYFKLPALLRFHAKHFSDSGSKMSQVCRYLTHTGVGISPTHVQVSHSYTRQNLLQRPHGDWYMVVQGTTDNRQRTTDNRQQTTDNSKPLHLFFYSLNRNVAITLVFYNIQIFLLKYFAGQIKTHIFVLRIFRYEFFVMKFVIGIWRQASHRTHSSCQDMCRRKVLLLSKYRL